MSFLKNVKNGSFWNIGFCDYTPENLIEKKSLPKIKWLKHPYRDRFFADPFILDVSESEIVVFVEEYVFDNPPGLIVELVIDRKSMKLKQRYELLRLPTHLSYPAIIRKDGEVLVYPENGASGKLNVYKYDTENHKLIDPVCILDEAVFDATICPLHNDYSMMVATKNPNNLEDAYLYKGESVLGPFTQKGDVPFKSNKGCARMAGDFFVAFGNLYRPAQDCLSRYGSAISIMSFDTTTNKEQKAFELRPQDYEYNLGIHTINFLKGLCVVDGYGYLYPTLGRLYASKSLKKIKLVFKSLHFYLKSHK